MTAKQVFLNRIKDKLEAAEIEVKTYKDLLTQNEKLPDSFFEGLFDIQTSSPELADVRVVSSQPDIGDNDETTNDYGRNKRVVVEILNKNGKAMLKGDIVKMFEQITGEKDATSIVTNAMAALSSIDKAIVGFKLKGVRVRGNYWALATWMDGEDIKDQYSPSPIHSLGKYLINMK